MRKSHFLIVGTFFESEFRIFFLFQTVRLIERTDADVKIFAGDVNALPFPGLINGKRQPYSLLTSIMTDSLVDRYETNFA